MKHMQIFYRKQQTRKQQTRKQQTRKQQTRKQQTCVRIYIVDVMFDYYCMY